MGWKCRLVKARQAKNDLHTLPDCRDWSKSNMEKIPKIIDVQTIGEAQLLVNFENDIKKIYDCRSLLSRPQFHLLRVKAFFNAVHVDPGGYGISWNDDIDLSEYELWTNGQEASDKLLMADAAKSRHAA
jgi:hypothetical protein